MPFDAELVADLQRPFGTPTAISATTRSNLPAAGSRLSVYKSQCYSLCSVSQYKPPYSMESPFIVCIFHQWLPRCCYTNLSTDIDECLVLKDPCGEDHCINLPGSYNCVKRCEEGYELVSGECVGENEMKTNFENQYETRLNTIILRSSIGT